MKKNKCVRFDLEAWLGLNCYIWRTYLYFGEFAIFGGLDLVALGLVDVLEGLLHLFWLLYGEGLVFEFGGLFAMRVCYIWR